MEYTKNYHLPQWAETDRILMADFNRAMADIENGLREGREEADGNTGALRETLLDRLGRLSHDLYETSARSAFNGSGGGARKAMTFNALTSGEELAETSGMARLPGGGVLAGPSTALTLDRLNAAITSWTDGSAPAIADSATAQATFHSGFRGTITRLTVWYTRTNISKTEQITVRVKLFDLGANQYAYNSGPITSMVLTQTENTETLTVAVPIEADRDYRLEFYTAGGVFTGGIGFGVKGQQKLVGEATGQPLLAGSIRGGLELEAPAVRAWAVVRYLGEPAPTVRVNGQTMAASAPRPGVSISGKSCTEREYALAGNFSGQLTLEANVQAGSQDVAVYDVGWYFV